MVLVIFLLYLTKFDLRYLIFLGHYPAAALRIQRVKVKGAVWSTPKCNTHCFRLKTPPAGVRREILFFLIKSISACLYVIIKSKIIASSYQTSILCCLFAQ